MVLTSRPGNVTKQYEYAFLTNRLKLQDTKKLPAQFQEDDVLGIQRRVSHAQT
jgi:hypothetical protein